MCNKIIL